MPATVIDELDWFTIIGRIKKGLCVPFLGAAANVKSGKYEGLPLGIDLALHMVQIITNKTAEEVKSDLKELEKIDTVKRLLESPDYKGLARVSFQDLTRVAWHVKYKTDFDTFLALLKNFILDSNCQPSLLLKTLARIPKFKVIVTTNYDRLMEKAIIGTGAHPEVIVQRIYGFNEEEQKEAEDQLLMPDARIIYKMHGTFLDEKDLDKPRAGKNGEDAAQEESVSEKPINPQMRDLSSQLIISEDDYIQFLTVIGKAREGVPDLIKSRIIDSSLLFLGYGLEDWDFRTIYKGLIETLPDPRKRKSFAIQKDPSALWVRFWEDKKVQIYNIDLYEFAEQLKERCQKEGLYEEVLEPLSGE